MQIAKEPYFLKDKSWYKYNGHMFKLTKVAPEKAIESYIDFYSLIESVYGKKNLKRLNKWLETHMFDDETYI